MKKKLSRVLAVVLTLVMTFSLAGTALAAGYDPSQGNGIIGEDPVYIPTGSTVTFVNGLGYDLTAQPGTSKNANGDVLVGSVTGIIPESRIPGVTAADAYYNITGWAVKDKDGNLEMIDLKTYRFNTNTKVYAVVEDVWTVYKDMKQDRSDWFYQYVRDLSIAGVVNGYPGYTFAPKGNVTWGEALKLVMLAAGYEEQAKTDTHWASGYLTKALEDGLVPVEKTIVLNDPITRLDYAQLAAKALKLGKVSIANPFADTDDEAVLALYAAKIVEGSFDKDNKRVFLPDDNITRAEISTVIWRINRYMGA